jgi:prophage regulatory protein
MQSHHGRPTSFMRLPDVRRRVGLSRSSIYLRISRGEFPAPVRIGDNSVAWISSEIDRWIESRIDASRPPARPPA